MKRNRDEALDLDLTTEWDVEVTRVLPERAPLVLNRFERAIDRLEALAARWMPSLSEIGLAMVLATLFALAVWGKDLPTAMRKLADDTAEQLVDQPPQM